MLYGVGLFLWALVLSAPGAQGVGVIGQIEIAPAGPSSRMADASNVAVWLLHLGDVDEAGRAGQVSQRVAEIPYQGIEQGQAPRATNLLFHLFDPAQFDPRQPGGLMRRDAPPHALFGEQLDARSKFIVQFLLHLALSQESVIRRNISPPLP